jgi:hypothetical protein
MNLRANLRAGPAINTFALDVGQIFFSVYAFRVMTPEATQRTALKKYRGPDPRTIMDAEILDIKDSAGKLFFSGGLFLPLGFRHFVSSII